MNSLSDDILVHNIGLFATPMDIWNLRQCSRYILAGVPSRKFLYIFKKHLIIHVMRICKIDNALAIKLLNNIKNSLGIISGSSILQVMYGEKYGERPGERTDLDVYLNVSSDVSEIEREYRNYVWDTLSEMELINCYSKFLDSTRTIYISNILDAPVDSKIEFKNDEYTMYDHPGHPAQENRHTWLIEENRHGITYVFDTNTNKSEFIKNNPFKNTQIIEHVAPLSYSDFDAVTRQFDLTCVMNTMCLSSNTLEVYNMDFLSKKIACSMYCKGEDRIYKYKSRGFDIIGSPFLMTDAGKSLIKSLKSKI